MWAPCRERFGIASDTASLAGELRRQGVEVEMVPVPYGDRASAPTGETLQRLNAADLIHLQHDYPFFGGVAPRASSLPLYLSRLKRPRVVTAHTVSSAAELLGLPAEERLRQRLAKQLLSASPSYRRSVERMPFDGAAAVIVHSTEARERMLARRLPPDRVRVVSPGVPTAQEAIPAAQIEGLRARLGLEGFRVVGLFGCAPPEPGFETALDALRRLPPAVRALVVNAPSSGGSLGALVREQGLEGRVTLVLEEGEGESGPLMAVSDVVLVPHTSEADSHAARAALGWGRPVLASDLPLFRQIHAECEAVELFPIGDAAALTERLGFLLASASARKRLSERAREYAARRTWSAAAEETLVIYRRVLEQVPR